MLTRKVTLQQCAQARGVVVVVDVLRAFTTAAYAFAGGAAEIILVGTVPEAFAMRARFPDALLMGEVEGLPIAGFDFGNSPWQISQADLRGRRLIQRTSAGVQGVVLCTEATTILTAGFCNAAATARYLKRLAPAGVTFVITGRPRPEEGDEDEACADYVAALLAGAGKPAVEPYLRRVRESPAGRVFADPDRPEFSAADLEYALQVDRFDFAMCVERRAGLLVQTCEVS